MGVEQGRFSPEDREIPQKLKVAICSTPWLKIPPGKYGGTENVVYDLSVNLPSVNVDFVVQTVASSKELPSIERIEGDIWSYFEDDQYGDIGLGHATVIEATHLVDFYKRLKSEGDIDVVHQHNAFLGGYAAYMLAWSLGEMPIPTLITHHGPLTGKRDQQFLRMVADTPGLYFNSISDDQRAPLADLPWVGTVHNGINVDRFTFVENKQNFLLSVARIAPDKGQHLAIVAAKKLGKTLVIAGQIENTVKARRYFAKSIRPKITVHLEDKEDKFGQLLAGISGWQGEIVYFGEANFAQKNWLFGHAACFVNSINWKEPFGLTPLEAGACGTPVVAFDMGAMREIIIPGRTGYLVKPRSVKGLCEAIERVIAGSSAISPYDCRMHIVDNFSGARMTRGYRALYDEVLKRERVRRGMSEREEEVTDSDAEILFALAFSREVPQEEGLEVFRQIVQNPPETIEVKELVVAEALARLAEDELPVWVKEFVDGVSDSNS